MLLTPQQEYEEDVIVDKYGIRKKQKTIYALYTVEGIVEIILVTEALSEELDFFFHYTKNKNLKNTLSVYYMIPDPIIPISNEIKNLNKNNNLSLRFKKQLFCIDNAYSTCRIFIPTTNDFHYEKIDLWSDWYYHQTSNGEIIVSDQQQSLREEMMDLDPNYTLNNSMLSPRYYTKHQGEMENQSFDSVGLDQIMKYEFGENFIDNETKILLVPYHQLTNVLNPTHYVQQVNKLHIGKKIIHTGNYIKHKFELYILESLIPTSITSLLNGTTIIFDSLLNKGNIPVKGSSSFLDEQRSDYIYRLYSVILRSIKTAVRSIKEEIGHIRVFYHIGYIGDRVKIIPYDKKEKTNKFLFLKKQTILESSMSEFISEIEDEYMNFGDHAEFGKYSNYNPDSFLN